MDFTTRLYPATHACLLGDFAKQFRSYDNEPDYVELLSMFHIYGGRFVLELLPKLGKAAELSLITLEPLVVPDEFVLHNLTRLPILLNYFFQKLWTTEGFPRYDIRDRSKGIEYGAADCVKVIRQFTLLFSKVTDVEPATSVESEVMNFRARVTNIPDITASGKLLYTIKGLIGKVVLADGENPFNPKAELCAELAQWLEMPWGRHGPGAVAKNEKGAEKWRFSYIEGLDSRLYGYYPEMFGGLRGQPKRVSRTSRLCLVPKDYRGRRVICIEPKELQFAQQGLMDVLFGLVHRHPLTRGCINFRDQAVSREMARSFNFATIDLKDASDLVSMRLCRLIFPTPFLELMTHWRSDHIELPGGETIHTNALATMGSALCFPLETLVFWAISTATIMLKEGILLPALEDPIWLRNHEGLLQVRVFGDDIIVPSPYARTVCKALQHCGLIINTGKTCIDSLVRESCGAWFFNRVDCQVVRLKLTQCTNVLDWISIAEAAKQLYSFHYEGCAAWLLGRLELVHPVPYGFLGFPGQGVNTLPEGYRWNCELQRLEVQVPTVKTVCGRHLSGYVGLYAYFTNQATNPAATVDHRIEMVWCSLQ